MKTSSFFLYDNENGRRWEYFKTTEKYFCQYWEFYKATGWKKLSPADEVCKEDYMESLSIEASQLILN